MWITVTQSPQCCCCDVSLRGLSNLRWRGGGGQGAVYPTSPDIHRHIHANEQRTSTKRFLPSVLSPIDAGDYQWPCGQTTVSRVWKRVC